MSIGDVFKSLIDKENNYYLPHPDLINGVKVLNNYRHSKNISTQMSLDTQKIWLEGPKSRSIQDLTHSIKELGKCWTRLIKNGRGKTKAFTKTSKHDWVSEVDIGIEILCRLWLNKYCPEHKIIGEEGEKVAITPQDVVWYLDPIDGTSNFLANKKQVALHIGSVKGGAPFISFVGLPFDNACYYGNGNEKICYREDLEPHSSRVQVTPNTEPPLQSIGTEYREGQLRQEQAYKIFLREFSREAYRIKSIGYHLMEYIKTPRIAFYKPKVKLWDVMAPVILLSFVYKKEYKFNFYFEDPKSNKMREVGLFSNEPHFISHLNNCHKTHCRAGLLIITHLSEIKIRDAIIRFFSKQ